MGVSGSDGLNGRKRGRVVTERENESNEGRREEGLKAEREGRRSTVELQSRRKPLQTNSDVCLTSNSFSGCCCSDFPPQRVSENDYVNKDFCPDLIHSPSVTVELQVGVSAESGHLASEERGMQI